MAVTAAAEIQCNLIRSATACMDNGNRCVWCADGVGSCLKFYCDSDYQFCQSGAVLPQVNCTLNDWLVGLLIGGAIVALVAALGFLIYICWCK